jgi:hypothetical protein
MGALSTSTWSALSAILKSRCFKNYFVSHVHWHLSLSIVCSLQVDLEAAVDGMFT